METNTLNSKAEISENVTVKLNDLVAGGRGKLIKMTTMKNHSEHNNIPK